MVEIVESETRKTRLLRKDVLSKLQHLAKGTKFSVSGSIQNPNDAFLLGWLTGGFFGFAQYMKVVPIKLNSPYIEFWIFDEEKETVQEFTDLLESALRDKSLSLGPIEKVRFVLV